MKHAIAQLQDGWPVTITPTGQSMTPRIRSGQQVLIRPLADNEPRVGDVVLVTVKGRTVLHLVSAIQVDIVPWKTRYQISNNHGHINGWVTRTKIHGKARL